MGIVDGMSEYLAIKIGDDWVPIPIEDHNYDPELEAEETFGIGQLGRYRARPGKAKVTGTINFLVSAPMLEVLQLALPTEDDPAALPEFEVDDGFVRWTGCRVTSLRLRLEEFKDLRATLGYTAKAKATSAWTPVEAPEADAFDAFFCETEGFSGIPDLTATGMDVNISNSISEHYGMKAADTRLPSHIAVNEHKVEASVDYIEDPGVDVTAAVAVISEVEVKLPDAAGNKLTLTLAGVLPSKAGKAAKRGDVTGHPLELSADSAAFDVEEAAE